MSKINAVRLINVNYNNNAIRISDECFYFNGKSTLLSLRNGGGKSVLVQMMTAPFVHKRYRDAKDRPFAGYFTTARPSFILVEWVLDQGAGYVLTGMMVRRNQEISENNSEELDMINFISEYTEPCLQDIRHLPVVEKGKKEIVLKSFSACRQLFESYKRERGRKFFWYDMTNYAQSRQYFDKLKEYQIDYREWEMIIKKVNLKESGLSELFADCRDEKGLVEKWFLEAVEGKLNRDRSRIREFQSIVRKYVEQYKDNRSKIERRDVIRLFREEAGKIREKAETYRSAEEQQAVRENEIACFIRTLTELRQQRQTEYDAATVRLEEIRKAVLRTEYERISSEIHALEKEKKFHAGNRDMIQMEQEMLEREREKIRKKLHLFTCARQQGILDEEEKEHSLVREKLEVARQRDQDLEPERNRLGKTLGIYYSTAVRKNRQQAEEKENRTAELKEEEKKEQETIKALGEELLRSASEKGMLKAKISGYSDREETYNRLYQAGLVRNILGWYEAGTLEILRDTCRKEQERAARERLNLKKTQERLKEEKRRLERDQEDGREETVRRKAELDGLEARKQLFDEELKERSVILRYLGMDEEKRFDTEAILRESGRRLRETAELKRKLEKEEDALQKEYRQLTQGKVLELPAELEKEFAGLGLHLVYGMEWLRKNGRAEKENQELVRRNPFLPYALILSRREADILAGQKGAVFTSFPVPVVVREDLEESGRPVETSLISYDGKERPAVSFYILFNDNLLNEEKLSELVREKEQQIRRRKEMITIRGREYSEYFQRQEKVRNQKVTEESWTAIAGRIRALESEISLAEQQIRERAEKLAALLDEMESTHRQITGKERELEWQKRREEDLERLCAAYEAYTEEQNELETLEKQEEKLKEKQKFSEEALNRLRDRLRTLESERDMLDREREELERNFRKYESYAADREENEEMEEPVPEPEQVRQMEARYAAVTAGVSRELQELEEQERRASGRCAQAQEELEHLCKKYGLNPEEWNQIRYSRKEEAHQESLLEDRNRKIEQKRALWNEEDKQTAVTVSRIKERKERMSRECGQEEPLPQEEIPDQDFEARRNQLKYQEQAEQREGERLQGFIRSYDENLTALSEYTDFPVQEDVAWENDPSEMTGEELRVMKGMLVRDYSQSARLRRECREQLTRLLNQVARREEFQDEFYRKPLESMLELTGQAGLVLDQLSTTVRSYDSLMEKLEVDISLLEKEEERVVELLEEYIHEVHLNLGKIDHNSTITIRERPVKMLRIELPLWEENAGMYRIRLQDMLDDVTQKGIGILDQGENAEEYFGLRITTRNLYDTVIGISNVQIRLYKIEEYREYPITWAEVAKNSGGEGFLSAFVILSSLLYYMRKDDTDIFAERNEGKVLLMDNPFAQTNASHLLKPLMDMAEKTNTQLICLTGLGGESIYNRFDNIYVLNLLAAGLRNGMQYLKAEHLRGDEPQTMAVSRIEVVEQQELVF